MKSEVQKTKKEVIYVYSAEHARKVFQEEQEKGTDFELNCVKKEQRVCSSADEIEKFYEGEMQ